MATPLKNPLENRPTVFRVLRSMNIDVNDVELSEICGRINRKFGSQVPKVSQRRTSNSKKKKVCCYPPEFIPIMKEEINSFFENKNEIKKVVSVDKPVKSKRPRIKKV